MISTFRVNLVRWILFKNGLFPIGNRPFWTCRTLATLDKLPEPPREEDCCQSGCANCVWIGYVQSVVDYHWITIRNYNQDTILSEPIWDKLDKEIDQIEDPSIRAFVQMEIKIKKEELLSKLKQN